MKLFTKKYLNISILLALVLITGITAAYYWHHQTIYPSTDDAYMSANVINIAAQVNGTVIDLPITNHQIVKEGQLLLKLDPRPYEYALMQAQAKLQLSKQKEEALEAEVATAKALLDQAQVDLNVLEQNVPRTLTLAETGKVSKAEAVQAKGRLDTARANFQAAKSRYNVALKNLGTPGTLNAQVLAAQAEVKQAEYNLEHTKIHAPAAGIIAQLNISVGSIVTAMQPQFALVATGEWWVNANFKETDMKRIKPQQSAKVFIDTYPGEIFSGYVANISPGSGSVFSLLPPENATGNWVKVTQRFPVKIMVNKNPQFPFRIGMSCTVVIDTSQQ